MSKFVIGERNPPPSQSPTPIVDAMMRAKAIFEKNVDTHIAMFLIRHPEINPADVEIVFNPGSNGKITFSIEPRELHVPPTLTSHNNADEHFVKLDGRHFSSGDEYLAADIGYVRGWNACRDAMIAQAKMVRAPEAMVSTLAESPSNG